MRVDHYRTHSIPVFLGPVGGFNNGGIGYNIFNFLLIFLAATGLFNLFLVVCVLDCIKSEKEV